MGVGPFLCPQHGQSDHRGELQKYTGGSGKEIEGFKGSLYCLRYGEWGRSSPGTAPEKLSVIEKNEVDRDPDEKEVAYSSGARQETIC
jgi:hypothetical protein